MTWPWPKTSPNHGGLVYAQDEHHAHTSSGRLEETGHAGTQGPARSGWKGFVPINFRMATDRPHISVVQPHSPIRLGRGTGVQPPSACRLGRGSARRSSLPSPPPPASNLGTTHHPLEATELAGAEPGEGGGVRVGERAAAAAQCVHSAPTRASQPITLSQRALSPRATSAVNLDTSSATAPIRIHRQTTAAVPG